MRFVKHVLTELDDLVEGLHNATEPINPFTKRSFGTEPLPSTRDTRDVPKPVQKPDKQENE